MCVREWIHSDVQVCVRACVSGDSVVVTLRPLAGHRSLFSRRRLCRRLDLILSFHFFIYSFFPSYLSVSPSSAHPDVSGSSLNHSVTERGKERGDGGRDKGASEMERGKERGMRAWSVRGMNLSIPAAYYPV